MRNYRSILNPNLDINGGGGGGKNELTINSLLLLLHRNNVNLNIKLKHQETTYVNNALELIDFYTIPFMNEGFPLLKDTNGKMRNLNGLTSSGIYMTLGYTDNRDFSIDDYNVNNIKRTSKLGWGRTRNQKERTTVLITVDYLPSSIGDINEIGIFIDIYNNGTSGTTSRFLIHRFLTETFRITSTHYELSLDKTRIIL